MRLVYSYLFPAIWIAFFVYWRIAAASVKAEQKVEPVSTRVMRSALFICAILLLCLQSLPLPWLYRQILPPTFAGFWAGAVITVAGILFAVWARRHIGSNWSSRVTLKHDHQLITSGPYGIVRHPIYTGILTGFIGSAIAIGQVRGAVAFVLVLIALRLKWRLEEKWMRQQFGQTYADYSRRVPAVVPRPM